MAATHQVDNLAPPFSRHSLLAQTIFGCLIAAMVALSGCDKTDPIITYRVPKKVPEELRTPQDRMLAAMVPNGDQVWFFKVTGPETAVSTISDSFRSFVEDVQFNDGSPDLSQLPDGWRKGGDKPMRFASIDIETPGKQLDVSVSQLGRLDDYDAMVAMNVNRWRNQLALPNSDQRWAEAAEIKVAAADGKSVWVDLVGEGGDSPMTPPFASGAAPFAGGAAPFAGGGQPPMTAAPQTRDAGLPAQQAQQTQPDERLTFDRPTGWRDGKMSTMRMAAFNVGPEDAPAEITVIPAGGDLRGNVARWIGQVREGKSPDDVVDQAMEDAIDVTVDGRPGQRFYLTSEDEAGQAIDATIVPLDGGMSLFIKMTGPAKTVSGESEAIADFLKSLKLKL
ncbi:hypothetical protein Poly51_21380 [Rubripirellula tenax]|uniref:Uncharacterized protein n=1 Tax=Rubripirellula tenax TaxID=2528015 RepID=A0A5C6FFN8_9BACT|nr:hypothetical protein [Rubripirellula tenax]TWU59350.1 hypothetical protein Poly51_21380 [Rubripirellula tenax]